MKIILTFMTVISIGAAVFAIAKIVTDSKKNSKSKVRR